MTYSTASQQGSFETFRFTFQDVWAHFTVSHKVHFWDLIIYYFCDIFLTKLNKRKTNVWQKRKLHTHTKDHVAMFAAY